MATGSYLFASAVVGAIASDRASSRATSAQNRGNRDALAEQREARAEFLARTQPFANIGLAAGNELSRLLGFSENPEFTSINRDIDAQIAALTGQEFDLKGALSGGNVRNSISNITGFSADIQSQIQALEEQRTQRLSGIEQFIGSDRMEGLEEINPVVSILRDQGFEQIQETAAAGGRLGAGGTLQDLTQFNSDLATVAVPALQNQRFNQLFNVLSLGSNAAAGQGTAILNTGTNISNLQTQFGRNRAEGIVDRSNIFTNALGNFAQVAGQNSANEQRQNAINSVLADDTNEVFSAEGGLF